MQQVYTHNVESLHNGEFTEEQARRKQLKIDRKAVKKADRKVNKVQMAPVWNGLLVLAVLASILGLFVYNVVFAGEDKRGFWIGVAVVAVAALVGGYKLLASDGGGAQLWGSNGEDEDEGDSAEPLVGTNSERIQRLRVESNRPGAPRRLRRLVAGYDATRRKFHARRASWRAFRKTTATARREERRLESRARRQRYALDSVRETLAAFVHPGVHVPLVLRRYGDNGSNGYESDP